jgi:arylsulfatase A-like enzyme
MLERATDRPPPRPVAARWLAALAVPALAMLLAGNRPAPSAPATARQPNILFILTDDLDLREVSVMPHLRTLLAARGATFRNFFVSVSLCCPSRSTCLRGQYAHNTGVLTNKGTQGGFETAYALGLEQSTVATWLHDAGYRTALIGKYLNGYPNGVSVAYVPPGWDQWDSPSQGSPYSEFNYTLNENGQQVAYGAAAADYGTDVYAGKAAAFITDAASAQVPFFVYLAVYAPHLPATPAPRHAGLFPGARAPRTPGYAEADVGDKPLFIRSLPLMTPAVARSVDAIYRRRLRSLQAVDEAIAMLIDTLERNGQLDDTYIVFTSDNGFHLGQHRMPAGKQTAYEEDIHVPLVVRGPGVPARKVVRQLTGNVDLAPTFAELAHSAIPAFVDGRSLVPLLHGRPRAPRPWRRAYLVEHWRPAAEDEPMAREGVPVEPPDPEERAAGPQRLARRPGAMVIVPDFQGIRTRRHLYVEYVTGERELYDLRRDRAERHNLAATARPHLLRRLAARLARLKACAGAECRAAEEVRRVRLP